MIEPQAPDANFPRLTDEPFPAYRFVPGLNAHPIEDPHGHSFGRPSCDGAAEAALLAREWRASRLFKLGVDLYNHAYWWEAHEAWEPLWKCFAPGASLRHALQALIQISAAHLHCHLGHGRGTRELLYKARRNSETACTARPRVLGLTLPAWLTDAVEPFFRRAPRTTYPFLRPE